MKSAFSMGCIMSILLAMACSRPPKQAPMEYVKTELAKLAPVTLECDLSGLTEADRTVLEHLVEAAAVIDELFLLQVDPGNPELRAGLAPGPHRELFDIMFGPWNRLEADVPFIGDRIKPDGAGYYPPDMSREEFNRVIASQPQLEEIFTSNFTVIRRSGSELIAVPYHEAYSSLVGELHAHLLRAAAACEEPTLKNFLELRASALLNDDYFDSDMAWMDLEGDLEVVIGPYEVYEDALFGYKAAYEAFICVVDRAESEKLADVANYLNDMEANLPIPDRYKNFNRGSSSPIKVVQEFVSAGDTKAGIQTTAFNLPNDERVREAKGSKKVMLKNVARAKFEKCWIPIVNELLAGQPLANVSFDAYFNHVLMHEMSHGLGPGTLRTAEGEVTTVNKALKELYSVIEECKADVLGIYNLKFLIEKGVLPAALRSSMYASYLGGMFRSIRFGIDEAHGGGVAIQFNTYMESGAFFMNEDGKLDFDGQKLEAAISELARRLLLIQAQGDYQAAREFVDKYRVLTPVMSQCMKRLEEVPIDIRPSYPELP